MIDLLIGGVIGSLVVIILVLLYSFKFKKKKKPVKTVEMHDRHLLQVKLPDATDELMELKKNIKSFQETLDERKALLKTAEAEHAQGS